MVLLNLNRSKALSIAWTPTDYLMLHSDLTCHKHFEMLPARFTTTNNLSSMSVDGIHPHASNMLGFRKDVRWPNYYSEW